MGVIIMENGIFYNGIYYPDPDVKRAISELTEEEQLISVFISVLKGKKELIKYLIEKNVLPEPWRTNDEGHLLYPVFIARDILKEVEAL